MSCVVAGLRYYFRIYKYEYLGELMTSKLHILDKPGVMGSIPGVPRVCGIVWTFIPAYLIKQPNGVHSAECTRKRVSGLMSNC